MKSDYHSLFDPSYPESVDGLLPGMFHLMVVCFLALQNVDLLEIEQREELESSRDDENHVTRSAPTSSLAFSRASSSSRDWDSSSFSRSLGPWPAWASKSATLKHKCWTLLRWERERERCAPLRTEINSFWKQSNESSSSSSAFKTQTFQPWLSWIVELDLVQYNVLTLLPPSQFVVHLYLVV